MTSASTLEDALAEVHETVTADDSGAGGLGPLSIQAFAYEPAEDEIAKGPLWCVTLTGVTWLENKITVPAHLLVSQLDPDPENIESPTVADAQALFSKLIDEVNAKFAAVPYTWDLNTGETQSGVYVATWNVLLELPSVNEVLL